MKRDKLAVYSQIHESFKALLETRHIPWEAALVSLIALLKSEAEWVSWVGLYRAQGEDLWVGPYQGPLACTYIPKGKGVCGAAFAARQSLIVPDVHAFPGHIACDALSRSEIVLPVWKREVLVGVLDLDSHEAAAFSEVDQKNIEKLLRELRQIA
jgi:L-methionine (R)-S-oxide reductase